MKQMNRNKIINIVARLIYAVSFIWIFKKITRSVFNRRKKNAIKEANERNKAEKRKIFVMQIEKKFIVGTRAELRRYNKTGRKVVKNLSGTHLLDFDYRNAVIYEVG
jgi:hypothetical protein